MVEDFHFGHRYWRTVWKNDAIESTVWLQLLVPFTAVKNIYLSKEFVVGIVAALQELVGGRITEVLRSLQNIFVEGSSHQDLFRKALDGWLPRDGSPVTLQYRHLSPFLTGTQTPTPQSLLSQPTTSTETADLRNLNGFLSHKRNSQSSPGPSTFEHLTTPR